MDALPPCAAVGSATFAASRADQASGGVHTVLQTERPPHTASSCTRIYVRVCCIHQLRAGMV
uniref:Uncharacterized protein n=1 Tax=Setaria italica TaxID=4555 RepID=K3ZEZ0_SETIT